MNLPEYMILKTSDLKCITDELALIRQEIASIKQIPNARKIMNVEQVCQYMGWSRTTYERMRRNPVLPFPSYKLGGMKTNYDDLVVWQQKYQILQSQGKI